MLPWVHARLECKEQDKYKPKFDFYFIVFVFVNSKYI